VVFAQSEETRNFLREISCIFVDRFTDERTKARAFKNKDTISQFSAFTVHCLTV